MDSTFSDFHHSDLPSDSFSLLNEIAAVSLDSDGVEGAMDELQLLPPPLPLFSVAHSNCAHEIHLPKAHVLLFMKLLIDLSSKADLSNTLIDLHASFPFLQHSSSQESAYFSIGTDSKSSDPHGASLKAFKGNRKRPAQDDSDLKKVTPFGIRITRSLFHKGFVRRRSLDEIKSAPANQKSSSSHSSRPRALNADFQYCEAEALERQPGDRPVSHLYLSSSLFGTVSADEIANYELLLSERWAASDGRQLAFCSSASDASATAPSPAAGEPRVFTCLLVQWETLLCQFLHHLLADGAHIALGDLLLRALVHLAGEPYRRRAIDSLRPRSAPAVTSANEQRADAFDAEPEPLVELCTCVRFGDGSPHSALEQYERFLALYCELFELLESRQPQLFAKLDQNQHSAQQLIDCLTALLAYIESLHLIRLLTSPPKTSRIPVTQHIRNLQAPTYPYPTKRLAYLISTILTIMLLS